MTSIACDREHESLILQVKARQQEGTRERNQWNYFCDCNSEVLDDRGQGIRDPARHPVMFLKAFFAALENGTIPEDVPEDAQLRKKKYLLDEATNVEPELVESAKLRAMASGSALLTCFPACWRVLYEASAKLTYDLQQYDFVSVVREMLDCPEDVCLSKIHEVNRPSGYIPCPPLHRGMELAGFSLTPEKKASKNKNKKRWIASDAYKKFLDIYKRFIKDLILPRLAFVVGEETCFEAVVQTTPVLRVVMPSSHVATVPHRDSEYGHLSEEINFWLPLTPVSGSNSLSVESLPDVGDYHAFEAEPGELFRWWGSECRHYAAPNSTETTRVSLDFRVVPKCFWDAAGVAGTRSRAESNRKFWHDGELSVGSYYYLEHVHVSSAHS